MRRIVVFDRVTADGFFADPEGRLDWFVPDEELDRVATEGSARVDAMLFGRRTYDMFESFWPHATGHPMAAWINDTPKLVFSRTRKAVTWKQSRLAGVLDADRVAALKREPGGDLIVFGSGSIVAQLTDLRLVDEYRLVVSPLFAGRGKSMLTGLGKMARLELLEARATRAGNVLLRYQLAAR